MILADKITAERKRNGWSQEQLAEQLDVSRQSVSKWEGAQSIPDINRIIQMVTLFGVSTDYVLKDDIEKDDCNGNSNFYQESNDILFRKVTLTEAQEFLNVIDISRTKIALGVVMCIIACLPLIILGGLAESHYYGISEALAGAIGLISLLVMIALGVFLFISNIFKLKKFEFLENEGIETEYGVVGFVRKQQDQFMGRYHRNILIGVMLCIFSFMPLLTVSFFTEEDAIITAFIALMLLIISLAVYIFIVNQMTMDAYNKLLQEGDYTLSKKKAAPLLGRISGIFWILATAIYLAWSLTTNDWQNTWIVWPIAGLVYAAIMIVSRIVIKVDD